MRIVVPEVAVAFVVRWVVMDDGHSETSSLVMFAGIGKSAEDGRVRVSNVAFWIVQTWDRA